MIHSQSQQIIGNRESQQDAINSLRVSPQLQLFVLADGMGGHNGGETASQSVIQSFLNCRRIAHRCTVHRLITRQRCFINAYFATTRIARHGNNISRCFNTGKWAI